MKFFSILSLAALATAIPTLVQRDAPAVVDAVNAIATHMVTLNTTVTAYNGGALGTLTALQIECESIKLSNALKAAIATTHVAANFTNAESLTVVGAFIALQPQIFSTLDNIVRKKPQFDTGLLAIGSLAFLVKANLVQQKDLSAGLGGEVAGKLAPLYAALAPRINQAIEDAFVKAIAAYS
ncbi:cell wall mannoprotein 1 family protein [Aspergillus clavatus NRRL 1]|uniref:Cell wall mannoprotein 1 n=1 Tax=Aspergillus clavatus (strain ATCC 1007 / CBS 513.65 / DSM 816 / NCTC 3887 / NRRL 1 / QM 1276 / 107) TaxID=344612 RepID=A1CLU3_ASPCL|nr:antigenic cell wall galactomannoprotein, putative [Aspergillus clavatus NRRL 1]EAW09072.1 antigenic cell wall galactomannoprotein, putative [Aspergillus clavatus NRRL 1]